MRQLRIDIAILKQSISIPGSHPGKQVSSTVTEMRAGGINFLPQLFELKSMLLDWSGIISRGIIIHFLSELGSCIYRCYSSLYPMIHAELQALPSRSLTVPFGVVRPTPELLC
jgi:hypothetical protein